MHRRRHNGDGDDLMRYIGSQDGRKYWKCKHCRQTVVCENPTWEHVCEAVPEGPGTELALIFHSLGFKQCGRCAAVAAKMNEWGAVGCAERIDDIVEEIASRVGIVKFLARAAIRAAVGEAIKRASRKCIAKMDGAGKAGSLRA